MARPPHRLAALLLLIPGCEYDALVGVPATMNHRVPVQVAPRSQVDVLLVADSSPSMAGKQERFAQALREATPLLAPLGSIHLGVVTTDLGAGRFATAGCRPDATTTLRAVGAAGGAPCAGLVGGDGSGYLDFDLRAGQNNLVSGTPADALACLPLAGTSGCAFEQPLEAARRTLTDRMPGGPSSGDGFLRAGAVLLVLLLTDEDDCSAVAGTDLFDPAATAAWGPLASFRCARAAIRTGFPPAPLPATPTGGPVPMVSASSGEGGPLQPLDGYVRFFTAAAPAGAKPDPNDVIVASFAGPAEPVEVIAVAPLVEPAAGQAACDGPLDGVRCAPALRHGCVASADPALFADPAPRLAALVGAVAHHYRASICAPDPRQALSDVLALVKARQAGDGCLPAPLADSAHPQCDVTEVTAGGSGARTIPACNPAAPPCWRLVVDPRCAAVSDPRSGTSSSLRLEIVRDADPPPGATLSASCISP